MRNKQNNSSKLIGRAIVIGGSIAGLLSARVLADRFETVIVIDRDKLPDRPEARQGVPQSVQPHVLLTKGYRIFKELFPDIDRQLIDRGAHQIDWVREFYFHSRSSWSANTKSDELSSSDVSSFTCSRPLLEWTIRQQLSQFANIQFLNGHRVIGLCYDNSKKTITGVRLRSIDRVEEEILSATLTVDASGRGSCAPNWLKELGFIPPPETVVNPFLGYATRRYKEPKDYSEKWKVMLISQSPPDRKRLGYLAKIEGGEWIATLGGYEKDFPPTDDAGFLEFARSLPDSKFYRAILNAEPKSPIIAHRSTANRFRHYEKIDLPDGFIALGDAVCALCPVYGQGMTVSALGAKTLQSWLKESSKNNLKVKRFQKKLAKTIFFPWNVAVTQDSRFSQITGKIPSNWLSRWLDKYSDRLMEKAASVTSLHALIIKVTHLLKSPLALYHPSVIFKVLITKK